jgi:hypothetical protein
VVGFRLPSILPLGADGFIQASGVLVWVGKDRAAAREGKGKAGVLLWPSHLIDKNIEQLACEVDAMGMARCSAFPKLDSDLGIPRAALSGGAHHGSAVLKGIDVLDQ